VGYVRNESIDFLELATSLLMRGRQWHRPSIEKRISFSTGLKLEKSASTGILFRSNASRMGGDLSVQRGDEGDTSLRHLLVWKMYELALLQLF
jgi:hypothetical protein